MGDPATWVFCDGLSPKNLMNAVRQGHLCVTRFCKIEPKIKVDGQDCLPGDEITAKKCEITYRAEILGLTEEPEAFLVMNGNYVELPVSSSETGRYHVETNLILERTSWQWIRLEVRTKKKRISWICKPGISRKERSGEDNFGEIKGETEGLADD